ncbi:MAG: BamA/TamA family outer membrane protein [Acidobacteriota bacterium]|nr:BamA/TamA family outer membrane protein [Acidobacteriota bacterium]
MKARRRGLWVAVAVLLMAATAAPAHAQYFGRNKVQYKSLDFEVMKTEHFDIYFYPQEKDAITLAALMAERWYARLSDLMGHELRGRQPLIIYASHTDFRQTNAIEGEIGEGTGGVTEGFKRRIVLPFGGSLADTDHVIGHELVHAFQYDITGNTIRDTGGQGPGVLRLPLWFVEGMAEYLSIGPVDPHTAMWLRDAAGLEKLPEIDDLDKREYFPYRWGHAFWAYIGGRFGDGAVARILKGAGDPRLNIAAIEMETGLSFKDLSKAWQESILATYADELQRTEPVHAQAKLVVGEATGSGDLNLSPRLSPDGRRIAFWSEKDLFSIELFLADTSNGRVLRKLLKTASDPHIDSLQFLNAAGAWSADGERFVLSSVQNGRAVLSFLDAIEGGATREVRVPDVDEIFSISWSPDARTLVFSGQTGGVTDLYRFDIQSAAVSRLTNDAFADLEPAFSPDGRLIAFATERFSSTLADAAVGSLRLGLLDVASGQVRELPAFTTGKHISPQWSPDSMTVYFVADPDGISNVYRTPLAGARPERMTNLRTGVAGITSTSPALSVASRSGTVAFSVYEDGKYGIFTSSAAGVATTQPAFQTAAVLPPRTTAEGAVATALANVKLGLPADTAFPVEEYKPKLGIDFVGQPSVGVGVDQFGTSLNGGISMMFSDMLGDRTLGATVQVNGELKDIGAQVLFLDRKHRWNWGLTAEHVPYRQGSFGAGLMNTPQGQVYVEEQLIERQITSGLGGILAYPFSRASRFEVQAGGRRINFTSELRTDTYDPFTGQQIDRREVDLDDPDPLNLAEVSGALVYDTSVSGLTSPILGQRYRLEVGQTAGSLQFTTALADYRKYVMPIQPITIAVRGMHYGRFGGDSEDPRMQPLFIGQSQFIRGYDFGSFEASECAPGPAGACDAFDRLIGTRLLVGNIEVRAPLWGLLGGKDFYGPLPIEIAAFADYGVAWNKGSKPEIFGGERNAARSYGAAVRANLFGFAIVEIDYVRPIDRPLKGWFWQFSLRPGF